MNAPARLRWAIRLITAPTFIFGLKGDASLSPVPRAFTALGPSFIKFGQVLSTRPDVTGDVLSAHLRVLQDRLPPFDDAEARRTVESELSGAIGDLFDGFGPPVAAASIAQVHPATEKGTGRKVAVKVLRPGIERAFRRDIDTFYFIARMVERFIPQTRRLHPTDVVAHFDGVVTLEMDLRLEAAAAAEFQANTKGDPGFRVPSVIWDLSARRVLTTEWVSGTPLGDVAALTAQGVDLPELSRRIVQTFLRHALRDGFFHADMHQGNLKVDETGALAAMDFGIMGRIDAVTRRHYAEILFGFLEQNYRRIAEVHVEAGYLAPGQDVDRFAQALRSIGEPIFGRNASGISMGRLLAQLFEVTEQFGMETRTELILLQRTMVVVEGVGRSLDPDANMWRAAQPVVEQWMRSNLGPGALARDAKEAALILARLGPRLPALAEKLILLARDAAQPPAPPPQSRRAPLKLLASALAGAAAALAIVWLASG